jgi:hypothetical protein
MIEKTIAKMMEKEIEIKNLKFPFIIKFLGIIKSKNFSKIEFKLNNQNFFDYKYKNKYQKFINDFGSTSKNWYIENYGIINLSNFSKNINHNIINYICSYNFTGTYISLIFYENLTINKQRENIIKNKQREKKIKNIFKNI